MYGMRKKKGKAAPGGSIPSGQWYDYRTRLEPVGRERVEFQQEFQCDPYQAGVDNELVSMAEAFCRACDTYDETVCTDTWEPTGAPVPATPEQRAQITKYAVELRQRLCRQYDITLAEFQQAVRDYRQIRKDT